MTNVANVLKTILRKTSVICFKHLSFVLRTKFVTSFVDVLFYIFIMDRETKNYNYRYFVNLINVLFLNNTK